MIMQLTYASSMMHHLGALTSLIILRAIPACTFTVGEPERMRPSLRARSMRLLQGPNFEAYKDWTKGPPDAGPHPATSYEKPYDACVGCVRFSPTISVPEHEENEGPGAEECRFGPCDFRDPQTQPWGGVIGGGSEADPETGWYKPPKPLVCFTHEDVSWYDKCDDLLYKEAATVPQVSTACEYIEQINVMGPFIGFTKAFERLGAPRKGEECAKVIEDGWTLYDDANSFNSDLEALHGCCETVHQYFTCVGDRKDLLMGDNAGLMKLDAIANHTVSHFSLFCVPMYRFPTKKEFCGEFPTSDPCVEYKGCTPCTEHGGVWCPDQKTCTKHGEEWCIRDPAVCDAKPFTPAPEAPAPPPAPPAPAPPDAKPDWYWQIIRATRLTNKSDIAVPFWTEANWTEMTSNYYINNPVQLVKQGKPKLFGPWSLKKAEKEEEEKEEK